jgi:hypothetical protein
MTHHTIDCDIYATHVASAESLYRAGVIAAGIDPKSPSDPAEWGAFDVQHALLRRIYEIESEACVLRSRLRAGRAARRE